MNNGVIGGISSRMANISNPAPPPGERSGSPGAAGVPKKPRRPRSSMFIPSSLLWGLWGLTPPPHPVPACLPMKETHAPLLFIESFRCLLFYFSRCQLRSAPILSDLLEDIECFMRTWFGGQSIIREELFEERALSCEADIFMIASER